MSVNFFNPVFLRPTWRAADAPADGKIIAFAGRSNAGKSSVLNALCNGRFARTARVPGRTRMVNLFLLADQKTVLADLPGYGYAKAPIAEKKHWGGRLQKFLLSPAVCGLVLVVDVRRGVLPIDEPLLHLAPRTPLLVLLNKSDKLGQRQLREAEKSAAARLAELAPHARQLGFSAMKKIGAEETRLIINEWLS